MESLVQAITLSRAPVWRGARRMGGIALLGICALLASGQASAQMSADHSALWTNVGTNADIVHVDGGFGNDVTRVGNPGQGTLGAPYLTVQFAVNDVVNNPLAPPAFPIVFNVSDTLGINNVHSTINLILPAYGVKLQTIGNAPIVLDGPASGLTAPIPQPMDPVVNVNWEGPRTLPDGSPMPATIIQGFTIRNGSVGVKLDVPVSTGLPLRTEIRDCVITGNRAGHYLNDAGTGIYIRSYHKTPTQYVIEDNYILDNAEFFWGDYGGSSWGIRIQAVLQAGDLSIHESSLIRGNQLARQETGIGIYGHSSGSGPVDVWVRPRILSNLLWDHEQHVWSVQGTGPVLSHNTFFRVRDYCLGPDRHIIHHTGPTIAATADPDTEQYAMIVKNCIVDHDAPAIEPAGTPVFGPPLIPLQWPKGSFCGGGSIFVSWTDHEGMLAYPGDPAANLIDLGNNDATNLPVSYVSTGVGPLGAGTDIHLMPPTTQIESAAFKDLDVFHSVTVGPESLPYDVRTDVDGHVRAIDFDRIDGVAMPDRGGDEVLLAGVAGMTLTTDADRTGNVSMSVNPTVTFTIQGVSNDLAAIQGWVDCPADPFDDVIYNHVLAAPFGNLLLPQCGAVFLFFVPLDPAGVGVVPAVPIAPTVPLETQFYFQAFGLTVPSTPALGTASNRVRIEVNP